MLTNQSPTWMGKQGALLSHVAPQAASGPPATTPSLKKLCALMDSMEWVTSWSRNWPHCIAMCDSDRSPLTSDANVTSKPEDLYFICNLYEISEGGRLLRVVVHSGYTTL